MAGDAHTYDPLNHIVQFGEIMLDSGWGPDEWIKVEHQSPAWEDDVGVSGEVQRSKINDHRGTVTITLLQTSRKNDALSAHYNLDRATPGGIGAKPFLLMDLGGTTLISADQAWLQKAPDQTRARKAGTTEWQIRLAYMVEHHGGNN